MSFEEWYSPPRLAGDDNTDGAMLTLEKLREAARSLGPYWISSWCLGVRHLARSYGPGKLPRYASRRKAKRRRYHLMNQCGRGFIITYR